MVTTPVTAVKVRDRPLIVRDSSTVAIPKRRP